MTPLYIIVEGPTEETFVNEMLREHLAGVGVQAEFWIGRHSWQAVRREAMNTLRQHAQRGAYVTTMFDLYALRRDFPGLADCDCEGVTNPYDRVARVEEGMGRDIDARRFIPYIQLHEFEALLFADIEKAKASYPDETAGVDALIDDVAGLAPELIDDGAETAPSKRMKRYIPRYDKVVAGTLIALDIGLSRIRAKCRHFDDWVTKLEGLDQTSS